jgi:dienelactone hydrolase
MDAQARLIATERDAKTRDVKEVALHEHANEDVAAAAQWLLRQPYVDPNRVVMSGLSFGGIQTVLSAEKGLGMKAFVAFAPGAKSWQGNPALQERLRTATQKAKAPMFVLQAHNDFSLYPSEELGELLRVKGKPNQAKVYPAFGATAQDGHGGFACSADGIAIWGPDVLAFLDEVLKPPKSP